MTSTLNLPTAANTAKFFGEMFGFEFTANECSELDVSTLVLFGDYSSGDNESSTHFIAFDVAGAAILGAALTGFPPSQVEEAVNAGALPDNLFENTKEILNIAVNLFPQSNQQRIVIEKIAQGSNAVTEYKACEGTPELRVEFDAQRYGKGKMVIGST